MHWLLPFILGMATLWLLQRFVLGGS